jgi:hypothetical protein
MRPRETNCSASKHASVIEAVGDMVLTPLIIAFVSRYAVLRRRFVVTATCVVSDILVNSVCLAQLYFRYE